MNPISTSRVDLHCHSTASEVSQLGIQRSLGLPECATPPDEVYELAKRRGMEFVTITDHDTIDGCLEIVDRDDVFISEELTVWFRGEPQAVHLLCFGITPTITPGSRSTTATSRPARSTSITRNLLLLAHPFYAVEAPLSPAHRRISPELSRCGRPATAPARASSTCRPRSTSRRTVVPAPAAPMIIPAWTSGGRSPRRPPRPRRKSFFATYRESRAEARGEQGSAAKWAHSAMGLGRARC